MTFRLTVLTFTLMGWVAKNNKLKDHKYDDIEVWNLFSNSSQKDTKDLIMFLALGAVSVGVAVYLGWRKDSWEVDRSSIKLGKLLGIGYFGKVYQGLYNNTPVAVKTLIHGTMNPQDFLKEAQIMKTMQHPNLIKLLAVCTKEEPIYIITELMKNGCLLNYLKDRSGRLCLNDQIEMAAQVASGMAYLEMKQYLHRDLAARNVLVGENNVYKVADFGLARVLQAKPMPVNQTSVYYIPVGNALFPLRWTAPEAIAKQRFTIKCDVWSFGILLYEIMTFGEKPYSRMNDSQVKQRVLNGYRMPCPVNCSKGMYKIMLDCWKENKNDRPTFKALEKSLRNFSGCRLM